MAMMWLKTSTIKQSSSAAFVFWRTGVEKCGLIRVSFDIENEDIDVAAELAAIHHLIFVKQVFKRVPISGGPYSLRVSRGAVRKLAHGKSDKFFARRYAKFLTAHHQFSGAEILVQEPEAFDPTDHREIEEIRIQHQRYSTRDELDTPLFGKLIITSHALRRFVERSSSSAMKFPRYSLGKRLSNPNLKKLTLDQAVAAHKQRKYGADRQAEVWGHHSETLKFVVIKDRATGQNVLATVFNRAEQYW
ncbi:hypothetical protein E4O93_24370 [Diaphorobacter sp. DS2]|nr:hypothetical protein E4O93_24370 [Diaphorobacter sp. DS2]